MRRDRYHSQVIQEHLDVMDMQMALFKKKETKY